MRKLTDGFRRELNMYPGGRSVELDLLKVTALFAVVFYHVGVQTYGYLGVDVFLVANGYLVVNGLLKQVEQGEKASYVSFLYRKLLAFWPLILLSGIVCAVLGFATMLPDDYENLAESIVATNLFANNFLLAITTKDYWAVTNDYKPLLHTWYIGVLMQSYFVLPIIPMATRRLKKQRELCAALFALLAIGSLMLYAKSGLTTAERFYFPQYRFYELAFGAFVACIKDPLQHFTANTAAGSKYVLEAVSGIGILVVFLWEEMPIANQWRLVLTCVLTMLFVVASGFPSQKSKTIPYAMRLVGLIGKDTFSFYIWHQIILAFVRYIVTARFTWAFVLGYALAVVAVGFLSGFLLERPIQRFGKKHGAVLLGICLILCAVSSAACFGIYTRSGVVRDVPELDIYKNEIHKGMHAEYNGRANAYDRPFLNDGKPKALVIGDSFGRDWINILIEANVADRLDLAFDYADQPKIVIAHQKRIADADIIFAAFAETDFYDLPIYLEPWREKIFIVGNKNFGESNGIIYNKRFQSDYHQLTVKIDDAYFEQRDIQKQRFGDRLIDLIAPVQNENGAIRVFTDTGKLISQDTKHFTQSGAQYYARQLDFSWLTIGD